MFLAGLIAPGLAQTTAPPSEPVQPAAPRATAPRSQAEAPPRPRSRNPRDRAYMDGGMTVTPGFSTGALGAPTGPAGRGDLAPRPNLDMELRSVTPAPETATLSPTMIHPRMPGRGVATDGAAPQREQRFLQSPAAGARLSVPMTW